MRRFWQQRFRLIIISMAVLTGALLTGNQAASAPGQPGSVDDPVVTKSYVDEQIEQLKAELANEDKPSVAEEVELIKQHLSEINQKIVEMEQTLENVQPTEGSDDASTSLHVQELKPGQTIVGFEGTEFIARTGDLTAVKGKNGDGLSDLTNGEGIEGGEAIPLNHLLLIPRSDGRGLKATEDSPPAWIVVRGDFEVLE